MFIAYENIYLCLLPLIYPLFRIHSIWPSLEQTADRVDRACKLECRVSTAWEYRLSPEELVRPLLKEVYTLLENTDLNKIFKIKIPRIILWALFPLMAGVFFHLTGEPEIPTSQVLAPTGQTTGKKLQQPEKGPGIQEDMLHMANLLQEVASGLEEGSLDEATALDDLASIKEKLGVTLHKEKGFLELSVKSELMVRFFSKLAKLDMILDSIDNEQLKKVFEAMSISIPIQFYNPNAPYDPRYARSTPGDSDPGAVGISVVPGPLGKSSAAGKSQMVAPSAPSRHEIGELIDTRETLETKTPKTSPGKIAGKRSSTGAPVTFFSVTHLPITHQRLVRSYFGSP